MVRDTLGEDAIIVATREEQGGKAVRVTAAIDPSDYNDPGFEVSRSGRAAPADDWLQYDTEDEESSVAEEITDALLRHAVPEDVMDQVISCATVIGFDNPGAALLAAIEHIYTFQPLPHQAHTKAIMMVGPPGAGKTLAAAKLAARSTMEELSVAVISTDTVRAGGLEQLGAFTNLLQIELEQAGSPQDLHLALNDARRFDQVIIDTAGLNPFNTEDVRLLAKLVGTGEIEPYLVMPGGIDAEESAEMARVFETIGVHRILPTRIDMARRLGGLLSAAFHGNLSFAEASNTPKVADGLMNMTPKSLAKLIMPGAYREKAPQRQSSNTRQEQPRRQQSTHAERPRKRVTQ